MTYPVATPASIVTVTVCVLTRPANPGLKAAVYTPGYVKFTLNSPAPLTRERGKFST